VTALNLHPAADQIAADIEAALDVLIGPRVAEGDQVEVTQKLLGGVGGGTCWGSERNGARDEGRAGSGSEVKHETNS